MSIVRPRSEEDQILNLMEEQARLAREVQRLQREVPYGTAAIEQAKQQHREAVNTLIQLLYHPLKKALEGLTPRLQNQGVQYTEMVHDFFLKLLQRRVSQDRGFTTMFDLRRFVATVLMNQFRDHLRSRKTQRKHLEFGIAPIAAQKQKYFEERFAIGYADALDQIEQWEESGEDNLQLLARAMLLHYVAGEQWGVIARELGISDERLNTLRKMAGEKFRSRL